MPIEILFGMLIEGASEVLSEVGSLLEDVDSFEDNILSGNDYEAGLDADTIHDKLSNPNLTALEREEVFQRSGY